LTVLDRFFAVAPAMSIRVKVWGDHACFTRPTDRVERMSYPIIPPPTAEGLLSAVFWKPEMRWHIRRVRLLKPPSFVRITTKEPSLRQTFALRDVAFEVEAEVHLRDTSQAYGKYFAQMQRRLESGQTFSSPYLGLRDFPARVALGDDTPTHEETIPVGPMPLRMNWGDDDAIDPSMFDAVIVDGVMEIPAYL
jgi:CRISPR-associated protein Cas5d